jgi:hypothetical protein
MKWLCVIGFMSCAASADLSFVPLRKAPPGVDGEYYTYRPDAARVEFIAPLSSADLSRLTVATLKGYSQEQLDQLYFRLGSGPFPQGDFRTTLLVKNALVQAIEAKLVDSANSQGLLKGLARKALIKALCKSEDGLECIGDYLWKGKRFYPAASDGAHEMRNAVPTSVRNSILLSAAGLGALSAPLKKAKVETFDGSARLMLFPANVYCGISLIDARRESIVIDYAYGDDFQPFINEVDSWVGRDGKGLRDEVRMIRPGLYLGRAYTDKIFLLNFVLESVSPQATQPNQCWASTSWQ